MRLKRFFTGSLRKRLMLYFTLLMTIPLFAAGSIIYSASDARISERALQMTRQVVEASSDSVNQVMTSMMTAGRVVASDETVQNLLCMPRQTQDERSECAYALSARLKQISQVYADVDGIYILLDDGIVAKSRYYSVREESLLSGEEYQNIRNHANVAWLATEQGSLMVDNFGAAMLSAASSISRRDTGLPCGIVVVEVRQSGINKRMSADLGDSGTIFLLNPHSGQTLHSISADESVVAAAAEETAATAISTKMETIRLSDRLLLCSRVPSTGWVVTGVVFKNFLRDDSRDILSIFVLVAAVAFLLNLFISYRLADFELRPINRIKAYVLEMEQGKFGLPLSPVRPDEIGELTGNVQEMSEKIEKLLEEVQTQQERMRTAEFKALQAQINPHFLYNSLDSINWLIRRGDLQKAMDMISAMTTFFRIGLSRGRDLITLREELEHARNYLVIQKIRYEDQFEYSFCVDGQAEDLVVPKLMLQPLVENALYHGIKPCSRKCMLIIQAFSQKDTIEIEVLDNGVGMNEQALEILREAMAHRGAPNKSYGVVNVNDRIQILAGAQYGLTYTSEAGVGTSVKICLPKTLKGE